MSSDVVIRIDGLWKALRLSHARVCEQRLELGAESQNRGRRKWRPSSLGAQRPESGDSQGETIGIIGRNGAGKSTLLKVLAGVTEPTRGRVEIHGRIFPMIELNAGLHMELTGRENVRLLAAVMGLSRKEIDAKLPDIEGFTELENGSTSRSGMYSTGMLGRLGFGVAVNIRSDVVLIDETFAVGDLRFQNKSLARVKQMRESGPPCCW